MIWYLGLSIIVALAYVRQLWLLVHGWRSIDTWRIPSDYQPTSFVSVLVCARNEEKTISDCLLSLHQQSYPPHLYEIILLDNHSSDDTIRVAHNLQLPQLRIVALADRFEEERTFKKEAISYGLSLARGDWIMVTDADCVAPPGWMISCMSFAEVTGNKVIAGPVAIEDSPRYIGKYQQMDMAGMMIATGGGLIRGSLLSANGANLAYYKDILKEIQFTLDSRRFVSGDDILLVQAIHQHDPDAVSFIKSQAAIVKTKSLFSWHEFLTQRRRWASKSRHLPHVGTRWASGIVWANSVLILSHLALAALFNRWFGAVFVVHLLIKGITDGYLLREATQFFSIDQDWKQQIYNVIFNPLYIAFTGFSVLFDPSYSWKGRKVK